MNTDKPRISIGLPVYNGDRFLEETLNSLLAQTYQDFELIISDNASTDQTEAICRAYAAKDRRIRYYRNKENLGLARNFNRVFELSTGEYFKWASSDDLCKPGYLARCIDVLNGDANVILTYARTIFIDESGKHLDINDLGWDLQSEASHERLRYAICADHLVNAFSGLIRSDNLSKTRLLPDYPGGDYRLLGELSLMGKFFEIPEYLFLRRFHPGSSSQNTTNLVWMVEYFKGRSGRVWLLPRWSRTGGHFITIMRSGLNNSQKLSLVNSLLRYMCWKRRDLLEELKVAFKIYFNHSKS